MRLKNFLGNPKKYSPKIEFLAYVSSRSVAVLGMLGVVQGAEGRLQVSYRAPVVPHRHLRPLFGTKIEGG